MARKPQEFSKTFSYVVVALLVAGAVFATVPLARNPSAEDHTFRVVSVVVLVLGIGGALAALFPVEKKAKAPASPRKPRKPRPGLPGKVIESEPSLPLASSEPKDSVERRQAVPSGGPFPERW